ncbi:tyrosine-type recombinase/integrase [Peribacillus frigoritolerans]|uniref:tyrosine-type recombinase/integrase n=1 Tax=Peribacillus frigoritolerans TaxID=450367 RepID=UPI003871404B
MNNHNSLTEQTLVPELFKEENLQELKKRTVLLGDFDFDDDIWDCYKMRGDRVSKNYFKIYFNQTPEKHKSIVKYFALLSDLQIWTRKGYVQDLNPFFEYLNILEPNLTLASITPVKVRGYSSYLSRKGELTQVSRREYWKSIKSFFKTMSGFPGVPSITFAHRNPFSINSKERKESRLNPVPQQDIEKLDELLFDRSNDIPLAVRVHYWTMRLFPERVNEVSSMRLDCLSPHFNHYILRIPSWKMNGGHKSPTIKAITVGYHGITKAFIDMIKELQDHDKKLYKYVKPKKHAKELDLVGYLYLYDRGFSLRTDENGKIVTHYHGSGIPTPYLYHDYKANKTLKEICKHLKIKPVTTHQFRHNSVTSRAEYGFTDEQIMARTGHKSKEMKKNYEHMDEKYVQAVHDEVLKELTPIEESPVIFHGTILNLKNKFSEKVLKQKGISSYLVGRLKKPGQTVGVCSQVAVEQCAPNGTPIKYECYACNWFVPIADKYDEYVEDYRFWEEKSESAKGNSNMAATYENAIRNMALLKRVINICENGIEKHKNQIASGIENEPIYEWK